MGIYFIAFGLSIFIYLLLNKGKVKPSYRNGHSVIFPIAAASIPPLLVAALRFDVGTDYFTTYYTGFYRIMAGIDFDQFEIGYWLLNKAVQLFTDNVFVMFAITALLFVGFSYAAIGSLSENVVLSILLFMLTRYFFIGMNVIRQFIALAIFAYTMRFAIQRDIRRYILFSCIAVSFHISTIILVPIYWLIDLIVKPRHVATGCIALLVGGNALFGIVSALISGTSKYGTILANFNTAGTLFIVGTIGVNVFYLLIYYSSYKERKDDPKYRCFLWLQILATLATMLLPNIPAVERVYWTYSFCSFISLPYMLNGIRMQVWRVIAMGVVIAGLGFYMFYDIAILGDHGVVPYESIIGHEALPSIEFGFRL